MLQDSLSPILHTGEGFLWVQFPVTDGMLRDGANELASCGPYREVARTLFYESERRLEKWGVGPDGAAFDACDPQVAIILIAW